MTCVDTNFDHHIALSMARCCPPDERDDCSKPCGSSHSSWDWEGSSAAQSSSQMPALTFPDKMITWADWQDDNSTEACLSPRSDLSECDELAEIEAVENELTPHELTFDEPCKKEQRARGQSWADLADSGEELVTVEDEPLDKKQRRQSWADLCDSSSEDEVKKGSTKADAAKVEEDVVDHSSPAVPSADLTDEPQAHALRSSRASRRTRAARAAAARDTVDEEQQGLEMKPACQTLTVQQDSGALAAKDNEKNNYTAPAPQVKSTSKGATNSAGKGATSCAGKGADKGSGKGIKGSTGKGSGKGEGKGKGKGSSKSSSEKGGGKGSSEKYQCQVVIGIEEDSKFRVVRRMIGSGGENMKNINQESQAKLRLRGRGSKFLEGEYQQESTDDLMLCISTQDKVGYEKAKTMASVLIEGIHQSYRAFCHKAGKECPELKLQIHEGYRSGSR